MKKLIYIAAPYTKGDVAINIRNAIMAADGLLKYGYIPFVPHLTHFWHIISPKPWETWLEIDELILHKCYAVLRLEGDSKGADREVSLALELGIPVYYSIEALIGD